MPSLNLDPDFFTHPKTLRLVSWLGPGGETIPLRLWCYAAKYHLADGSFAAYSDTQIERLAEWNGEPGRAIAALYHCGAHIGKAGFIHIVGDHYELHNWQRHEGHLAIFKARAQLAAENRWRKGVADGSLPNIPKPIAPSIPIRNASSIARQPPPPPTDMPRATGDALSTPISNASSTASSTPSSNALAVLGSSLLGSSLHTTTANSTHEQKTATTPRRRTHSC